MSSALGTLVAKAILDTSEFTVGANKAERAAAKAAGSVDNSLKKMEASTKLAIGGIAASIAAGLGVAALKGMFDSYVETAAKAEEVSKKFGLSVEWLSGIEPIAKAAGLSFDDIGGAVGKFAKSLVSSTEETKGARKALAFLGIEANDASGKLKPAGDLVDEIAQKIGRLDPSLEKSALAMDLFGKSGTSMIEFLDDLNTYGERSIKLTKEQADLADEYQKDIVRLGIAKEGLARTISAALLPTGAALVKTMLELQTATGGVKDEAKRLAGDGSIQRWAVSGVQIISEVINAGHGFIIVVEALGKTLGFMAANAVSAASSVHDALTKIASGDISGGIRSYQAAMKVAASSGSEFRKELETLYGQQLMGDKLMAKFRTQLDGVNAGLKAGAGATKGSASGYESYGAKVAKAAEGESAFAKAMEDAHKRIAVSSATLLDPFGKLLASEKALLELQSSDKWSTFTASQKSALIAVNENAAALERQHRALLASQKTLEEIAKHQEQVNTQTWAGVEVIEKSIAQKELEIATYGLVSSAVTEYTAGLLEAEAANLAVNESATSQVAALRAQAEAMRALAGKEAHLESRAAMDKVMEDERRANQNLFETIADYGQAAFESIWDKSGRGFKGFLDSLWSDIKSVFARIAAQRIIVPIVMSALGTSGSSGLLSGIGGLFSSVGTGATYGGSVGIAGTLANLGKGGGSFGFQAGSLLGAFAPYAAAATAIASLYRSIVKPRGGAKDEGGAWHTFGAAGNLTSAAGFSNGQNFHRGKPITGNEASNASARSIVDSIAASYFNVIKAVGGNARGFTFGLDFDSDPKGTAGSRVWGNINDSEGRAIRRSFADVGRGDGALDAGLKIESQRMLLTALKASDMPAAIKTMFDSIDIETITGESASKFIDQVQQYAAAYAQLRESLDDIDAAMHAFGGDTTAQFKRSIDLLRDNVASASLAFDEAMAGADPTAQVQAQQNLMNAVNARYETEMRHITELRGALDNIANATYQFRFDMASRINAAGGTRDIAGLSRARINALDGEFAGASPERRLRLVSESLAAIDNYQSEMARRRQVEAQAMQGAQQAIANAQRAAIASRIDGLNQELAILQNMAGVRDRAADAIKQLTFSGANPLSAQGRFAIAGADVTALQAAFRTATGDRQAQLGSQIIDALNQRFAINGEINQRSSDEALAVYNETIAGLAEVRDVAQTEAERALNLQARIADLQTQANGIGDYGNAIAESVGNVIDSDLLAMYERMEEIGNKAYEEQQLQAQEQFDYLKTQTELQRESRAELQRIREAIEKGNDAAPVTIVVNPPSGSARGDVIVLTPSELADTIDDAVNQYVSANASRISRTLAASN